ncbi:cytochrome C [Opitutaceae bacterium EW11]|nr:cytochrome C [Opitutaceae bacterium EW11]
MIKKVALVLAVVLVLIQFIRPAIHTTFVAQPKDLFALHPAPAAVQEKIRDACYDCHSMNTRMPWYAQVQPIRWWLADHIREGRQHLNFSQFADYPAKRAARKLQESIDEIRDDEMPLPSYTWIHTDARLTAEDEKAITEWLASVRDQIKAAGAESPSR